MFVTVDTEDPVAKWVDGIISPTNQEELTIIWRAYDNIDIVEVNLFEDNLIRFCDTGVTFHSSPHGNRFHSCTFKDCRFVDNHANSRGGGMYIVSNVDPILIGCRFDGNEAELGGAREHFSALEQFLNREGKAPSSDS